MSYHSDMMSEYYAIRESEEQEAEWKSLGYATELNEWHTEHPRTTFKQFLEVRKCVTH